MSCLCEGGDASVLLPCPFCGGNAKVMHVKDWYDTCDPPNLHHTFNVCCENLLCLGSNAKVRAFESERLAIEAWNTRHETTCRNALLDRYEPDECEGLFECSICGSDMADNFCSGCGSRVVE